MTENKPERFVEDWEVIFDSIEDPIFVIDNSNTIRQANRAFVGFIGKKKEDVIGKKCHELLHKLNHPWPGCPFEDTKIDKKVHAKEVNDPTIGTHLLVTTSPIFDPAGRMTGAVHTAKDITDYKKSEEALRESETRYRAIFNSSSDAIMLLTPEKGFTRGNITTLKMFGCKDEKEFIAQSPASLSPQYQPDGRLSSEKAAEMMKMAIKDGSNFFEWKHRRISGEEFFATVLLTRLELPGKEFLQATVRDITEQKMRSDQLAKKIRDLEIFYKAAIDREMRIKELKKRVAELEGKDKN